MPVGARFFLGSLFTRCVVLFSSFGSTPAGGCAVAFLSPSPAFGHCSFLFFCPYLCSSVRLSGLRRLPRLGDSLSANAARCSIAPWSVEVACRHEAPLSWMGQAVFKRRCAPGRPLRSFRDSFCPGRSLQRWGGFFRLRASSGPAMEDRMSVPLRFFRVRKTFLTKVGANRGALVRAVFSCIAHC